MGHMGTHAASVPLYPKLAYNPEKDFRAGRAAGRHADPDPGAKDFPAKDLKEFIAYVKANETSSTWRMPASARSRIRPASC
jgi:tripartite-type tricarboxylate transporter receptor subunit TctC